MSHNAKAVVVHCMDFRLQGVINKFIEQFAPYDEVSIAGAAKKFIGNKKDIANYLLSELKLSHDLHNVKTVVLINHHDCGAYGGVSAFTSLEAEKKQHHTDLKQASRLIAEKLGITVKAYFMDFSDTNNKIHDINFIEIK